MKRIDANYAPKGYHAVYDHGNGCTGCAFQPVACPRECGDCYKANRPDGRSVIFVKNEKQKRVHKAKEAGLDKLRRNLLSASAEWKRTVDACMKGPDKTTTAEIFNKSAMEKEGEAWGTLIDAWSELDTAIHELVANLVILLPGDQVCD